MGSSILSSPQHLPRLEATHTHGQLPLGLVLWSGSAEPCLPCSSTSAFSSELSGLNFTGPGGFKDLRAPLPKAWVRFAMNLVEKGDKKGVFEGKNSIFDTFSCHIFSFFGPLFASNCEESYVFTQTVLNEMIETAKMRISSICMMQR
jgi:hypothetical protein